MVPGFRMGNDWWAVHIVPPTSPLLIDRTNRRTVATTDVAGRRINVSSSLHGGMLARVLVHESAHAAMASYGISDRLRRHVPPGDLVAVEELICNILADHGMTIISAGLSTAKAIGNISRRAKGAA